MVSSMNGREWFALQLCPKGNSDSSDQLETFLSALNLKHRQGLVGTSTREGISWSPLQRGQRGHLVARVILAQHLHSTRGFRMRTKCLAD